VTLDLVAQSDLPFPLCVIAIATLATLVWSGWFYLMLLQVGRDPVVDIGGLIPTVGNLLAGRLLMSQSGQLTVKCL
jgi:hypothetical protein